MIGALSRLLVRLSPRRPPPAAPRRILLLKPCCIGDVVFTTPLLSALQRGYPSAQIDWAIGGWSAPVIAGQPGLHRVIDVGTPANPASTLPGLLHLVRTLRAGQYDLLIVPDRSPLLSLAAWLSGIPNRAGLDSAGRGFGYTVRASIIPEEIRHEADIYLDIARALGLSAENCWANVSTSHADTEAIDAVLADQVAPGRSLVLVHPGGGVNPGMQLTSKRWPPQHFAALAERVANFTNGHIIVLGSKIDASVTSDVVQSLRHTQPSPITDLTGTLTLTQIAALAAQPRTALYIGNDNGVAHLAAAAGAKVLMIFGPSDPRRYAPFVPPSCAAYAWRPVQVPDRGVGAGAAAGFDWTRDGVTVEDAWTQANRLLGG